MLRGDRAVGIPVGAPAEAFIGGRTTSNLEDYVSKIGT